MSRGMLSHETRDVMALRWMRELALALQTSGAIGYLERFASRTASDTIPMADESV